MDLPVLRVDLHVHSKFSKHPSEWMLQKLGCSESYTDPRSLYHLVRSRGMSHVTITDHNTIEGSLEIAHLPQTFISEEVTTYFPEDRCKVHVVVYSISERQHQDLQYLRENIYDFTNYLYQENITHTLAHPLYSVNEKLTIGHFERCLLLFKNFELNGSRGKEQNTLLKLVLGQLTPQDIQSLTERYGLQPRFDEPWKKNLTGGSDDHSALTAANQYTEVAGAKDLPEFLEGINRHRATVVGSSSSPQALAHTLYSIAYQFYNHKFNLNAQLHKDIFLRFLHRFLSNDLREDNGLFSRVYDLWHYRKRSGNDHPSRIQELLRLETHKLLLKDPHLMEIVKNGRFEGEKIEDRWFYFVNQVSHCAFLHFGNTVLDQLTGGHLFNLFQSLGSVGALYALLSPYFFAFSNFSNNRQFARKVSRHFLETDPLTDRPDGPFKVAHFTDTFNEINGVALTLRQQVAMARKNGKKLTVITCDSSDHEAEEGIKNFKPVGFYELPEYQELKLFFPPFLEMLAYCYEEKFTAIHSATPGPIGLAALGIAKILKLPIYGTYHTALPQYARYLTEDKAVEDWMWRYMLWYYDQMDTIYVPSKSSGQELIEKGCDPQKIRLFFRGVDLESFHPSKRNGFLKNRFNLGEGLKILYVGRVSKEKNLSFLGDVFMSLCRSLKWVSLVVVGDGPYLEEFKKKMQDTPCVFTGYLKGEELACVYASCDLFVFPSRTDTFGNVVLEARASGIPVIVTDQGGPKENILPGKTGLVIKDDQPHEWLRLLGSLHSDPRRLKEMGQAARHYMEDRSFEEAFLKTWEMYEKKEMPVDIPFAKAS
jgi:glycosyltransferase involved in cell wall biosynthesis